MLPYTKIIVLLNKSKLSILMNLRCHYWLYYLYFIIIIISFVLHYLFYCITWYSTVLHYIYIYKYRENSDNSTDALQ